MAMTLKADGLDALGQELANLGNKATEIASAALFDGAKVVADAMSAATKSIKTAPFKYAKPGETRLPSPQEKSALDRKVGIASFQKTGDAVDTLIGLNLDGYAKVGGKVRPVAVIARSINSGTSFMDKQPVYRQALSKAKAAAVKAAVDAAEEKIKAETT